ncbi:MAG: hypothetical protein MUF47_09120 [Porphyrobacter sp.]|jgi:hypothetical protein|nr:hypothetical protein [Porphyrobacter sp.]
MGQHFDLSRRGMLAGSVAALALPLPAEALGQVSRPFPALVKLSWDEGDPARRSRLIAAVTAALAEFGADLRATWVLADA